MALLAVWTRECENATNDLRSERSGLSALSKRFMSLLGRLQSARARATWRHNGEKLSPLQKIGLDAMIIVSISLLEICLDANAMIIVFLRFESASKRCLL